MSRRIGLPLALLLCAAFPALAREVPKQPAVVALSGQFDFTPGRWALYDLKDLRSNVTARLYFSVLEPEKQRKGMASWMEVEVKTPDQPTVVTRFLAPQMPTGPGEAIKAIVQVGKMDPFVVPSRYLKPDKTTGAAQVGAVQPLDLKTNPPEWSTRTIAGKEVRIGTVKATDAEGRAITAVIGEQVGPLGLVEYTDPDREMRLVDWGTGATTKMTGKPVGMIRWIWRIIWRAMTGGGTPEIE